MGAPRYSVLYSGHVLSEVWEEVSNLIESGIKVFWFGTESDNGTLNDRYGSFAKAYLLNTFPYDSEEKLKVVDGDLSRCEDAFATLSARNQRFNSGQYLVEHSRERNIVVKASAGTGKTKVMVDRVLFLVMTGKMNLADIVMITFTNEATNEMARRLILTSE